MAILSPKLTATPSVPPTYNTGMAETFSWVPVEGAGRPLFAKATYIANFEDFSVSLSAAELSISSISLKDGNSGRLADVEDVGGINALRVLTQNLDPVIDTISLADVNNNPVTVTSATSSLNVNVTNASTFPTVITSFGLNSDAFGRLRTSTPLTLFDSSHRYQDNGLWATLSANGGSIAFNANQGLIELITNTTSGAEVVRETTKVFAYQAGKSLLTMNTFVMSPSTANLRQRVGYFGQSNGIFLELDGSTLSLVKRSLVGGSVSDTKKAQSTWNVDPLNGTGPSGLTLDITKAQILWMDFEWLGVGTVRTGFVINGQFIHCHSFHHANLIDSTYITTASLPVRYEITNTGTTSVSNTLKQICSTVISEGGYELRGEQRQASTPITSAKTLATAGTFYPAVSLRLKTTPNRLDAIAILSNISLLGVGNGNNFQWRLVSRSSTTGGTWTDNGTESSVEYNVTGTSATGGKVLASGFLNSSNQASPTITIPKADLFKFQLERNRLTSTPYEISLQVACAEDNKQVFASMDWEEVTR